MKRIIIFNVLIIIVLCVCGFIQEPTKNKVFPDYVKNMSNPHKDNVNVIKRGEKIYKKQCWVCHGDNGTGNGPQAADLNTKPACFTHVVVKGRSDGEMFYWIANGGNDMQPYKDVLEKDEIWKTVSYIRFLQK